MTARSRFSPLRLLAVLGAALMLGLGFAAPPAAAHDGEAVVVIEDAHPAGTSVHYVVRVTWADDGHPAADATVTATGVGADGTQLTPVPLDPVDGDGRFAGVVEYPAPGSWTVRVTSIEPTGSAEQAQEITAPATDDGAPTDGAASSDDDEATAGFAPADDGTGSGDEQAAADGSGDSGMPVYLLVAAAAVVVIGAATAVNIIRRRGPGSPHDASAEAGASGSTESGAGGGDGDGARGADPASAGGDAAVADRPEA